VLAAAAHGRRGQPRAVTRAAVTAPAWATVSAHPIFRVDHMPYGGNRMSGIGREGVRFAVEEMTNLRMVCFNLE
jgi:acyl-CoA reductase-like NAD-dependent aldehyde dehydrogenase